MVDFFTSPEDLGGWIKSQQSPDTAAKQILDMVKAVSVEQSSGHEQDITDTCKSIYEKSDENASKILFGILASHKLTTIKQSASSGKLTKEAQIMRQPGEYEMDLRICPKLPFSVGKRLISKYNCRHYCLDGVVFDDDPERVYCAEAMWRRHIMDKFAREFKDKEGHWVGGYINDRFHVIPKAGTPANPDVPRDGGNQMELAHGERTRKPRPHQYSIERRLSEARGEETHDLMTSASEAGKIVKLASTDRSKDDDAISEIFTDMLDMKEAGWTDDDIIYHTAEHYSMSIPRVASVYKYALKLQARHNGMMYVQSSSSGEIKSVARALAGTPAVVKPTGTKQPAITETAKPANEFDIVDEDMQNDMKDLGLLD